MLCGRGELNSPCRRSVPTCLCSAQPDLTVTVIILNTLYGQVQRLQTKTHTHTCIHVQYNAGTGRARMRLNILCVSSGKLHTRRRRRRRRRGRQSKHHDAWHAGIVSPSPSKRVAFWAGAFCCVCMVCSWCLCSLC